MKRSDAVKKAQEYLDINDGKINGEQLIAAALAIGLNPPSVSTEDAQALMHVYMDPCFYR
jgi:hypothetical protein